VRPSSLLVALALVAAALPACGRSAGAGRTPKPGTPNVRLDVVSQEARWFDAQDPLRAAGSQQELTAASYLLGRLERAGYTVNLDPVPVGNLLHSTNVLALPASGHVATVVIVDYDTSAAAPSDGAALGTFLEVARATQASQPNHTVEFAALGAEHVVVNGGQVGSRSLIELLKDQSPHARIIRIAAIRSGGSGISASGPQAPTIAKAGDKDHVRTNTSGGVQDDVFTSAGLTETTVAGGLSVGPVLLTFLTEEQGSTTAP
jgi:hypothetical protein